MTMTEDPDQRAERLLAIGLDIAVRIRDEHPDAVVGRLADLDPVELRDLVMLLAAGIDIGVSPAVLYGWTGTTPRLHSRLHPAACGTQAAVSRHRRRGEKLDPACRAFDASRSQRTRDAARSAA